MSVHHRHSRSRLLVLVIALLLAAGLTGPALAAPRSAKTGAITAMESKPSELRRDAQGRPLSSTAEVGDSPAPTPDLGSSDLMGTPADKTVLRQGDQVLRETRTGGRGAGNTTTAAAYGLNAAMTAPSSTPPDDPMDARATIDHGYPSVGGRFLDATREGVLQFKKAVAGSDALFSLTSSLEASATWSVSGDATDPQVGTTYQIVQGGVALTNTGVAPSSALGKQISSAPLETQAPTSQLWSVVDAGHGDGSFFLVNRADGLCLARDGAEGAMVTADSCEDDVTRLWREQTSTVDGSTTTAIYPANRTVDWSVGSDGGTGVAMTLGANTSQTWSFRALTDPVGAVPSWSVERAGGYTAGSIAAPYAMAAGDLDGQLSQDPGVGGPAFHDEAVVAYTDSNDNWAIRVLDYNADASHLLVTAPDPSLVFGKNGTTTNGVWFPGDLVVEVGDFNGDGQNEIVTGFQNGAGTFYWTFWGYRANPDGSRSLNLLSSCIGCAGNAPFSDATGTTLAQGYADSAVGDFDGDSRDDLALAFATTTSADTLDPVVNLGVWTLNSDLSTRSVVITRPPTPDGSVPRAMGNDPTRASSGIELVAGNLYSNPDEGFGPQRSELAIAWSAYKIGPHYYNPLTMKDEHPYVITPEVMIYKVVNDCNDAGTTCSTTTSPVNNPTDDPTNSNANPVKLFPDHPSETAYRDFGTPYDAAPLSLEVGAFGGTGDPKTDPPVDGLLASAWLESSDADGYYTKQSIVVPWVSGDATGTQWTISDSKQGTTDSHWQIARYTAYDRNGQSLVLGAPTIMDVEQRITENVVAAEPPTQVDWLNGDWSNVSATSAFYLQTKTTSGQSFTSQTSIDNTWQNGVHEGVDVKASWSEDLLVLPSEKGYVDVNQKFSKAWSGLTGSSSNASTSWSTSAQAQTNQDDAFSFSADDARLYRYPVLGSAGTFTGQNACTSGCRSTYDVYVPKRSAHFPNVPGKSTPLFSPSWQNMNALSYPAIDSGASNPVPTPDLGSYSYNDTDNKPQSVTKPLYNGVNTAGANTGNQSLDFSTQDGAGTTTTHARTWTVGTDVTASGTVSVGSMDIGDDEGSLSLTASLGFDVSKATSDTTTGSSSTTSAQEFVLNFPEIGEGQSYDIGTAYYYSKDGAAKVVHGVDLTPSQQSQAWWRQNYGETPDPALNLPGRIELGYNPATLASDIPHWLTAPQRQLIRGFEVLQPGNDSSGLPTAGDPYTVNPSVGQAVTFSVPVHNYSLTPMTARTTAHFYAVPVDANDITVTGSPLDLGTSDVPAIAAQGTAQVQAPAWTAVGNAANSMQKYRIVVRIDEAGTAADLHPLAGATCPTTSLEPKIGNDGDPALYDIMKSGNAIETLGCGQNNQGYGLVTVSPPAGVGAERHASAASTGRAQLDGAGLVTGDPDHLQLSEKSAIPTIPVGQRITGLVHATAELQTNDHPLVAVYDGPVSDGKIITVARLDGIDDETGGHVPFSWTPDEPGLHELHQVLLGTKKSGEDDEQILRVDVAAPLDPYTVTAKASPAAVDPGAAFSVTGTVTPVPDRAGDRRVELQRLVGDTWRSVDSQQTSGTGRFDFDLTAGAVGGYQYRVLKNATAGRHRALSAPVSVVVGGFAVTARATPVPVDPGRTVTLSGRATPAQALEADRGVQLQAKTGSSWKTVATTTTDANGRYSFRVERAGTGSFGYRVRKTAAGGLPEATSPTVTVRVTPRVRVTASARPTAIRAGKSTVLSGRVTPTTSGRRALTAQRRSDSGWREVARTSTNADGRYQIKIRPSRVGTWSYRVVTPATAGKQGAHSRTVRVQVTR